MKCIAGWLNVKADNLSAIACCKKLARIVYFSMRARAALAALRILASLSST
jgi:hypothetical protein